MAHILKLIHSACSPWKTHVNPDFTEYVRHKLDKVIYIRLCWHSEVDRIAKSVKRYCCLLVCHELFLLQYICKEGSIISMFVHRFHLLFPHVTTFWHACGCPHVITNNIYLFFIIRICSSFCGFLSYFIINGTVGTWRGCFFHRLSASPNKFRPHCPVPCSVGKVHTVHISVCGRYDVIKMGKKFIFDAWKSTSFCVPEITSFGLHRLTG